ncbi:gliding motility protein GldM [Tenacibaculum finnmarkense]|uniref:Gliding motility transmembrane protein GldM n=1 Tax=Tenacibaculum finnmarkense genomovar ulcerans TaxID=2781388 RepID=A0A2I2M8E6_9FLAO|nr:gliding motility protein GldM [Tenacibaculum finnmarkense]MBE7646866.1 gliding motility protein GldM [Tenacibaculum finnmarkense genomovar ulcerans]MBE7696993.1 gliding motility protein GldM [Tenacibaculum finnmarkense genomovar ulcerans]MCD8421952.1 gliding motility protein GldM [Tenacibaculum finnmarkense genomovar ulcerans]MCD8431386.1 gliding motility protein GldM [Tenacibaculum finnmarkense genomovar ulcerans]MCD8444063.1 gliding motility protein GldM [Tenacibaculum finnmarkense genomo
MAGGKQSPRQMMVNLMYLVFISMLAMNMSKEVLSAFGLMNEKLSESNVRATEKNTAAYATLAQKATEQAKQYGKAKEDTDKLRVMADGLFTYISDLKTKMTSEVKKEDIRNYESMDKSGFLDQYFFASGKISPKGKEFMDKMNQFREESLLVLKNQPDLSKVIAVRFSTKDVKSAKDGLVKNWLKYNYEGFPLIASLTKLTQIQADIKNTEADALTALLQGELESAVSMSNYDAMVVFDKNAYYPGEKLSGKIVLGKNDPNLTAEKVILNGKVMAADKIKAGQVILDGPAGSVGDKELKGEFQFKQGDSIVTIPILGGYSVIPKPNEAVVSADKMNVVYRGLSNPLTISVPGVSGNKVSASAPGLRRIKGDKYVMNPGKGSEVTIRVSATLPGGGKISTPKKYRIKDIPPAVGMVRNQYGTVKMPKASLARINVAAGLPDFLFDLKLNVSSFKVKVPGQVTIPVNGRQLNARAKKALAKARRNDIIVIYDIKASVSGSNYKLKKVLPVSIEITN